MEHEITPPTVYLVATFKDNKLDEICCFESEKVARECAEDLDADVIAVDYWPNDLLEID